MPLPNGKQVIQRKGNHDAYYISRVFNAISGGCRQSTNPEIPRLLTSMQLNIALTNDFKLNTI